MKRYLWLLALPALAAAQLAPIDVTAPTLGYVWEQRSHTLRPVEGVPGSASVGNPINLGISLESIAFASNRRFAIGSEADSANAVIIRLDGAIGWATRSAMPRGAVFFAPSADTVAVSAAGRIEVWTGVTTDPRRLRTYPEAAGRLFVSDDGTRLLALEAGALYDLNSGNAEAVGEGFRDLAFLKSSHDAVAAHITKGVVLLHKAGAGSEEMLGAVESPLAIALSADEKVIAVLNGDSIALIDRASQQASEIALDGRAASSLIRAQGNAVFQLAAEGDLWYLDADVSAPRLVTVNKGELQ